MSRLMALERNSDGTGSISFTTLKIRLIAADTTKAVPPPPRTAGVVEIGCPSSTVGHACHQNRPY